LYAAFEAFAKDHPWVMREVLKPKSVAREMVEHLHSFSGYVKEYGLSRSEGTLLRYLSEVYKTLVQTIPALSRSEAVDDVILHLGTLVRGVDSSLLDEWERLRDPGYQPRAAAETESVETPRHDITTDARRFTALIRNLMFGILRAIEYGDYETIPDLAEAGQLDLAVPELQRRIKPFYQEHQHIQLDANARNPVHLDVTPGADFWTVRQAILADDEVSQYSLRGRIDLERSRAERRPVLLLDHLGSDG
jgi:hypothetical protein